MFESIRKLRPYFFSLREIDSNVSLDIKLPVTWKYDEVVKQYRLVKILTQDKNEKLTLLSLICPATQEGYDVVFTCALEVILTNKEEEEKQKLLQMKIKELQELFRNKPLEKLKQINLIENYGQEIIPSEGMVGQGNGERPDGSDIT